MYFNIKMFYIKFSNGKFAHNFNSYMSRVQLLYYSNLIAQFFKHLFLMSAATDLKVIIIMLLNINSLLFCLKCLIILLWLSKWLLSQDFYLKQIVYRF